MNRTPAGWPLGFSKILTTNQMLKYGPNMDSLPKYGPNLDLIVVIGCT